MDHQKTFDTVVKHLRRQAAMCFDEDNQRCAYRHNGMSCAVGILIPDDTYHPEMEGILCTQEPVYTAIKDAGHCPALALELQMVHDMRPPSDWDDAFKEVADRYGLVYQA